MAIVPRSNPQQIHDIAPLPGVRNETRVQAIEGVTEAAAAFTRPMQEIYQQAQDRADTAAVMEAQRELSSWQNDWFDPTNERGVSAHKGLEALSLQDRMLPDLDGRLGQIEARLPSDRARQKFREYAGIEREQIRARIGSYATAQAEAGYAAQREAFETTRKQDLVGAIVDGDPNRSAMLWGSTAQMIHADAAANGRSAEETALRMTKLQSDVHAGVLDLYLARGDTERAETYFRRNIDRMLPSQQAVVERALRPMRQDAQGDAVRDVVIDGGELPDAAAGYDGPADGPAPNVPPEMRTTIEAAADRHGVPRHIALAMAEQESGFNPKAVGPATRWGKAGGLYQFLESTANAKGIDRFDPTQAANAAMEDLAREGRAKGWDWAVAHHHAGPDERQHGPKTRAYVEAIRGKARRYAGNEDAPVLPPAVNQAEALARLQRIADPSLRKVVAQKVRDEFAVREARQEAAEQAAGDQIYQKIAKADPDAPLRHVLDGEELAFMARDASLSEAVNRFRKLSATGTLVEDDDALVDDLARLQANNPAKFKAVRLAQYADRLSGKTLLSLTKAQQEASDPAKRDRWATEEQQMGMAVDEMGLAGSGDAARRGQFRRVYYAEKRTFIENNGREPNADEAQKILNRLQLPFVKSGFLGIGGGTRRAFEEPAEGFHVPADERKKIVEAFKRNGLDKPGETDIVAAYIQGTGDSL